jgi:hypothetical protein
MKSVRLSPDQMVSVLQQAEANLGGAQACAIRQLRSENLRLRRMVERLELDTAILRDVARLSWQQRPR